MKLFFPVFALIAFLIIVYAVKPASLELAISGLFILYLILPIFSESKKIIITKFKYLLIWFGIFFVGFVIISYQDVFLNNRLMAHLVPGKAQYLEDKLVFFAANDNHFYINADINNVTIKFMLDTGASDIVLSKNDARKLGFDPNRLNYNKIYNTANGSVRGASIILPRVIIGNLVFENVRASVNDGDMSGSLLGISFLQLFSSYSFEGNKVTLAK
jgi:aspartyl protease family protein